MERASGNYAFVRRTIHFCVAEKTETMDELIDRIEVDSDQKAVDLIEVCSHEGFPHKVPAINHLRACHHLRYEQQQQRKQQQTSMPSSNQIGKK